MDDQSNNFIMFWCRFYSRLKMFVLVFQSSHRVQVSTVHLNSWVFLFTPARLAMRITTRVCWLTFLFVRFDRSRIHYKWLFLDCFDRFWSQIYACAHALSRKVMLLRNCIIYLNAICSHIPNRNNSDQYSAKRLNVA